MCLYFSFIMKGRFARYRNQGWQFFSSSTWKILCHFLLASTVLDEKSTVMQIGVSLQVMHHFPLPLLRLFLLSLVFRNLIYYVSWCGFLWIYPYLEFVQLHESMDLGFSPNLGSIQLLFLLIVFQFHYLFLFFLKLLQYES